MVRVPPPGNAQPEGIPAHHASRAVRHTVGLAGFLLSSWMLTGGSVPVRAGGPADVSIDFLADGRCAVSAAGEGFRSKATYRPDGAKPAGERRCAMPPVPAGRTVSLTVSLPEGAARPGSSTPELEWQARGSAWVGTASLTSWPEAVVVSPAGGHLMFTVLVGLGLLLTASAVVVRRRRRES